MFLPEETLAVGVRATNSQPRARDQEWTEESPERALPRFLLLRDKLTYL